MSFKALFELLPLLHMFVRAALTALSLTILAPFTLLRSLPPLTQSGVVLCRHICWPTANSEAMMAVAARAVGLAGGRRREPRSSLFLFLLASPLHTPTAQHTTNSPYETGTPNAGISGCDTRARGPQACKSCSIDNLTTCTDGKTVNAWDQKLFQQGMLINTVNNLVLFW